MGTGAAAVASACVLVAPSLQRRAGLAASDFLSLHQLKAWPHTRARRGDSPHELATKNSWTHMLVHGGFRRRAAAICRTAYTEDPTRARFDAGARHFAVNG